MTQYYIKNNVEIEYELTKKNIYGDCRVISNIILVIIMKLAMKNFGLCGLYAYNTCTKD